MPTAVNDATADVNMFLIIGALRGFNIGMAGLRKGEWRGGAPLAHDPQGKVLGILGMGGIGRTLKRRTDAFDMKVIYHNRTQLSPHLEGGAQYVSFDELLVQSDVISLNLPLNVSFLFSFSDIGRLYTCRWKTCPRVYSQRRTRDTEGCTTAYEISASMQLPCGWEKNTKPQPMLTRSCFIR